MDNISDEIIAAVLDGNATPEEQNFVLSSDELDSLMSDFRLCSEIEESYYSDIDLNVNPYQQSYSDTCAIKSQQLILNDFGIPCTEDELVRYSTEQGWYTGNGTSLEDVGKLLEDAGIPCTRQCDANVFNLVKELSQGHKVIVGVDSNELWGNRFIEWFKDFFLGQTPDHALLVTGIDTSDPDNIKVIVTDPGTGEAGKAYPLSQFMDAWSDASCYMCSTDAPVPATVPGMDNFDYLEGHLPEVAGMGYSQFEMFNDISMGLPVSIPQLPLTDPFLPIGEYAQWEVGQPMTGVNHPVASLMDAYFDVAQHNIGLQEVFQSYDFNQYLDTATVNDFMGNRFINGMSNLTLDNTLSWDNYALSNGIHDRISNMDYADYLNETINSVQNCGDYLNADILNQQQFILNYCDGFNINFYDTFLS